MGTTPETKAEHDAMEKETNPTCQERMDEAQRVEGNWYKETKQSIDIMHWCGTNAECKEWIKDEPLKHIEHCFNEGKLHM